MTRTFVLVAAALIAALASGIVAALAGNGTPINASSKNPLTVAVIGNVQGERRRSRSGRGRQGSTPTRTGGRRPPG